MKCPEKQQKSRIDITTKKVLRNSTERKRKQMKDRETIINSK